MARQWRSRWSNPSAKEELTFFSGPTKRVLSRMKYKGPGPKGRTAETWARKGHYGYKKGVKLYKTRVALKKQAERDYYREKRGYLRDLRSDVHADRLRHGREIREQIQKEKSNRWRKAYPFKVTSGVAGTLGKYFR